MMDDESGSISSSVGGNDDEDFYQIENFNG
jgi:hypothetical protein